MVCFSALSVLRVVAFESFFPLCRSVSFRRNSPPQSPVLHLINDVAGLRNIRRAMAGQKNRLARLSKLSQQRMNFFHRVPIHRVERLVEHQHIRIFHDRLRKAEPLPHAQRIPADGLALVRRKPQRFHRASSIRPIGAAGHVGQQHQVRQPGFIRQKAGAFDDYARLRGKIRRLADRAAPLQRRIPPERAPSADQTAVHENIPRCRLAEPADAAHQRRFAAAVCADQPVNAARFKPHRDLAQNLVLSISLGQVFNLNHRLMLSPRTANPCDARAPPSARSMPQSPRRSRQAREAPRRFRRHTPGRQWRSASHTAPAG